MKIGILGYKGFLGNAIYSYLLSSGRFEVVGIDRINWVEMGSVNFDILVDSDGSSSKYLASTNFVDDFDKNAVVSIKTVSHFKFTKYLLISSIDVYNNKSNFMQNSEDAVIDPIGLSNYGFSKYVRELIVRRHAPNWLILRLGGLVGDGLKKGPIYDILTNSMLYLSQESQMQFIDTSVVSEIIEKLIEKDLKNVVFNLCGRGQVLLRDVVAYSGIEIKSEGKFVERVNVNIERISKDMTIPDSLTAVKNYVDKVSANRSAH